VKGSDLSRAAGEVNINQSSCDNFLNFFNASS